MNKPPGLLQVMREKMRLMHMSLFTEKTYIHWVRRFIHFHRKKHPRNMWAHLMVVSLDSIQPGKPTENAYI
jgi:hypothetical protein